MRTEGSASRKVSVPAERSWATWNLAAPSPKTIVPDAAALSLLSSAFATRLAARHSVPAATKSAILPRRMEEAPWWKREGRRHPARRRRRREELDASGARREPDGPP